MSRSPAAPRQAGHQQPRRSPHPGLRTALGGVAVMVLGIAGLVWFLVSMKGWEPAAGLCGSCAPEQFRSQLESTLLAALLPAAAGVLGVLALLRSLRAGRSLRVVVLGAVAALGGLALTAVLLSTAVAPLQRQAAAARQAQQAPTAEETSRPPEKLRAEIEGLVRASLTEVRPLPGLAGDSRVSRADETVRTVRENRCTLSNLADGRGYSFSLTLQPSRDAERVSEALEQYWLAQGYARSNPSQGGDVLLSGEGRLPGRYLSVSNDTVPGELPRVLVKVESICVAG